MYIKQSRSGRTPEDTMRRSNIPVTGALEEKREDGRRDDDWEWLKIDENIDLLIWDNLINPKHNIKINPHLKTSYWKFLKGNILKVAKGKCR